MFKRSILWPEQRQHLSRSLRGRLPLETKFQGATAHWNRSGNEHVFKCVESNVDVHTLRNNTWISLDRFSICWFRCKLESPSSYLNIFAGGSETRAPIIPSSAKYSKENRSSCHDCCSSWHKQKAGLGAEDAESVAVFKASMLKANKMPFQFPRTDMTH